MNELSAGLEASDPETYVSPTGRVSVTVPPVTGPWATLPRIVNVTTWLASTCPSASFEVLSMPITGIGVTVTVSVTQSGSSETQSSATFVSAPEAPASIVTSYVIVAAGSPSLRVA